eukprot:1338983-Ditylum_brightwellii.AAC.1
MPTALFFNKPSNKNYHNLCTHKQPPQGEESDNEYVKRLYIKSKWNPPPETKKLKSAWTTF